MKTFRSLVRPDIRPLAGQFTLRTYLHSTDAGGRWRTRLPRSRARSLGEARLLEVRRSIDVTRIVRFRSC